MKIFITGGAGYIGGSIARILLGQGHEVTIYDNLFHSKRESLPAGATFVLGDLTDRARLEETLRATHFDGVMHFAGLIEVGDSVKHPETYFRNNTVGTLTLLEAMTATGHDRLIFSSTAAVYGEPVSTPILETAALKPTNPYGESKLMIEQMLAWFNAIHGLRYAALRYFNVAGAMRIDAGVAKAGTGTSAGANGVEYGELHEPETHVIPLILDVALGRREKFLVFGNDYATKDGTCVRDYIHIGDLAQAHLLALAALGEDASGDASHGNVGAAKRLIYNIGNGQGFSVLEVIESARRVTGHPIPIEVQARRGGDPAVLVASSEKIKSELGWKPAFADLDAIVASAWEWHKKRYEM